MKSDDFLEMHLDGLSVKDELLAIRVLELARWAYPEGGRVGFVRICEESGIRPYFESFPELWAQITDVPPRPGITPSEVFSERSKAELREVESWVGSIVRLFSAHGIRSIFLGRAPVGCPTECSADPERGVPWEITVCPREAKRAGDLLVAQGLMEPRHRLSPAQEQAWYRFGWSTEMTGQRPLRLCWRTFPAWFGDDILPFEELWERRENAPGGGPDSPFVLSTTDALVFTALRGSYEGGASLEWLLRMATGLERSCDRWEEILERAGARAILMEKTVELVVRLLGVPHPARMSHHYSGHRDALERWWYSGLDGAEPEARLMGPRYWSCDSGEAVVRRVRGLFIPEIEDILSIDLPSFAGFLYPLIRALRLLVKRRLRGTL